MIEITQTKFPELSEEDYIRLSAKIFWITSVYPYRERPHHVRIIKDFEIERITRGYKQNEETGKPPIPTLILPVVVIDPDSYSYEPQKFKDSGAYHRAMFKCLYDIAQNALKIKMQQNPNRSISSQLAKLKDKLFRGDETRKFYQAIYETDEKTLDKLITEWYEKNPKDMYCTKEWFDKLGFEIQNGQLVKKDSFAIEADGP